MSATSKVVGLVAGLSAVAAIGIAVAQGVPPNPYIGHHALGAGQQSTHLTAMGETGVLGETGTVRTATIVRMPEVAIVEQAPVVAVAPMPAPAPAPVFVAQVEAAPAAQTMGAAPEAPARKRVGKRVARADRN